MTLHERIIAETSQALKGGDAVRLETLRLLLSALHNREIEKRPASTLTDEDVVVVVEREAKKRKEAMDFFEKGGRPERAAKEKEELAVLETYLPPPLPEAELDRLVAEAIATTGAVRAKDFGKVMGAIMKAAKGARVDGAMAGMKVRACLAGRQAKLGA